MAGITGVAALTVACWLLTPLTGYAAIALIYLLGVLLSGMILRPGAVLVTAALSAACWNFLFIPPLFTLHIGKLQDALMFLTYFVVALTVGSLTSRLRAREQAEREREHRATSLYRFAQKIAAAPSIEAALAAASAEMREMLRVEATLFETSADERGCNLTGDIERRDDPHVYVPIKRFDATFGWIRIEQTRHAAMTMVEQGLLDAFAAELASMIERIRLMELAAKAQLSYQAERLRKALFDCVSHELKTPIAAIRAASQQLLRAAAIDGADALSRELAHEIENGSQRLNHVVNNLLDMTRLESGVIKPKLAWCEVGELLQGATDTACDALGGRSIKVDVPADFPLVFVDHALLEQAIAKLLVNAANYTAVSSPIEIAARCTDDSLMITVADRGPGIPTGALEQIFEKFYRANGNSTGGLGLGLSIARGFVEAHSGTLTAENRLGGGVQFNLNVPVRITDATSLDPVL